MLLLSHPQICQHLKLPATHRNVFHDLNQNGQELKKKTLFLQKLPLSFDQSQSALLLH